MKKKLSNKKIVNETGMSLKLTRKMITDIVRELSTGLGITQVLSILEINSSSYYYWKELGEKAIASGRSVKELNANEKICIEMVTEIEKTKPLLEQKYLVLMEEHSKKHWQACYKMLESINPPRYMPKEAKILIGSDENEKGTDEEKSEKLLEKIDRIYGIDVE